MFIEDTKNKYGSIADFNSKNYNKRYVFVLNHQNPTPTVQGKHFPNSFNLPMVDEIFDYDKGTTRLIRYVPGELSIYKDEQSDDHEKTKRTEFITFSKDGDVIIDGKDRQRLEFMMKSNWNGSNPVRNQSVHPKYWMVDLNSGLKLEKERDEKLTNAKQWCYEAKWDQIKSYARVMGLDVNRDPDEVRWALKLTAEKDPIKFLAGLNNKLTERKHYILEAVDKGILTVDPRNNSLSWANGSNICVAPMGKSAVDHFVDLTQNEEGQRTYESILGLVMPSAEPAVKMTSQVHNVAPKSILVDNPIVSNSMVNDNSLKQPIVEINKGTPTEQIINLAISKNIIEKSKAWIKFNGKSYRTKDFYEEIEKNSNLIDEIKKATM
jgi:hypothetical protein